jgi:hypothetical protein
MKRFFDPVSLQVLNLVPLPNNDALVNNFQGPISPARNITDEVTARIDYHISSKDSFYGRYIYISTTTTWAIFSRSLGPAAATAVTGVIATTRT